VGEADKAVLGDARPARASDNGCVRWIWERVVVPAAGHWPVALAVLLGLAGLAGLAEVSADGTGKTAVPDSAVAPGSIPSDPHALATPAGTAFAMLSALAVTLPVALVRVQPAVAAIITGIAFLAWPLTGDRPPLAGLVSVAVIFYAVAERCSRRTTLVLLTPFAAGATAPWNTSRPFSIAVLAVAAAAAALVLVRRARAEAAQRNVFQREIADTLLEHVARGERARIARELHDVVAHHISMIAVQAEAARLTTTGMPPEGAKRLIAIGDTARAALTEMRRLLGVLREDAGVEPDRRPQPGLQQLTDLLDEARELSAASTRLIVRGPVRPLDPGIELTAYRIVQEALTNARRHAPGAAVDVELHYRDEALHVWVRDNGPGREPQQPDGGGHGLTGMRERAAMVGGRLAAAPASRGGFVVSAVLPLMREDGA
jgi:signal transduction histidine kinase